MTVRAGQEDENSETEEERRNALFKAYRDEQRLYAKKNKKQLKKGSQREQQVSNLFVRVLRENRTSASDRILRE